MVTRTVLLPLVLAALAAPATGQNASSVAVANLNEDINGLNQRLADLTLRVEQLENRAAQADLLPKPSHEYATTAQLTAAVTSLSAQVDELRAEVRKLTAAPPPAETRKPAAASGASFPHTGMVYVVQRGDTLASIAKKTGGKFDDILAANSNQLADPSKIRPGQKLFIPIAQ